MTLSTSLRLLTWAVYLVIFLLVLRRALRTPTRTHADIAIFFGATAVLIVLVSAQAVVGSAPPSWLLPLIGVVAILLPYLLLRLLAGFAAVPGWLRHGSAVAAVACIAAFVFTPQPTPMAVGLLVVIYFGLLAAYDTLGFTRAAQRSTGVTRRRMQFVALGSLALTATVLTSAFASVDATRAVSWTIIGRLLALGSGLAYYLGFSPPIWLRRVWQAPALEALLAEITELPYLPDVPSVLTRLEAHAAAVIGAPTAAIGVWLEAESVLRFWRGLGLRFTPASYPEDVARHGFAPHADVVDVPPDRLFAGRAFLEQRPLFTGNVIRDDPDNAELYASWQVTAVLASPITSNARRLGVLTVWSPREPVFAESDLELVDLVAHQAAAVLESRALLEQVAEARAKDEMDRLKDRFLASISHDLRNPLTAVAATAQLVQRRLDRGGVDPERLRASMTSIDISTRQMASMVDQLLDYARLQLGRPLELHLQPVDLVELTRTTVAASASVSDQHVIHFETSEPTLVGDWDYERLARVLQNLLGNAVKYSPGGGDIWVRLRHEQTANREWAVLSVQDPGVGIPAADLQEVFEGFHRGTNVSARIPGTGIGLATARQVVEQHGGTLSVESVENQGSTFTVRLPRGAPGGPVPGDSTPPPTTPLSSTDVEQAPVWQLQPGLP